MYKIIITLLCIIIVVLSPSSAGYYSETLHNGGDATLKSAVYQSALDGAYKFGETGTLSGTMNEQGNTHATVTLNRSAVERTMSVEATTANSYVSKTKAETGEFGMLNSYDNAGIIDMNSNKPDSICDGENIIQMDGNLSTSRYPSEQYVSGMFGTMSSNVRSFSMDTAVIDDTMANSQTLNAGEGTLLRDVHTTATKGFNKSDTSYGYTNRIDDHALVNSKSSVGIDDSLTTVYNGFDDAYNTVLNTSTVSDYTTNATNSSVVTNITYGNQT